MPQSQVDKEKPAPGGYTDRTAQNPASGAGVVLAGWKGLSDLSATLKSAAGQKR